jgi:hypothetical protein
MGVVKGSAWGDYDNDGWADLYVSRFGKPNLLFRNDAGKRLVDVTGHAGVAEPINSFPTWFFDYGRVRPPAEGPRCVVRRSRQRRRSGHLRGHRRVVQRRQLPDVLFHNPGHGNRWITISLEGVRSNRMGIGARLKIRVSTSKGPRDIYQTVSSGGSFGDSSFQQETGLGDATSIESIEVTWPVTGRTQVFRDVAIDQFVRIREGDSAIYARFEDSTLPRRP